MEFFRPEYCSGLPFPSPGDLPNSGIEPRSPTPQVDTLPVEPQGKPKNTGVGSLSLLQGIFPTQEWNQGIPDVQVGFRKGRGTKYQIANIRWIIEKEREFHKNFCFVDYTKAFHCVDHNKQLEIRIPDHLTCLLRILYAGQEATVRTEHGTMDWFPIGKGVCQGCMLSLCLFNLYAEYIMKMLD